MSNIMVSVKLKFEHVRNHMETNYLEIWASFASHLSVKISGFDYNLSEKMLLFNEKIILGVLNHFLGLYLKLV